MTPKRPPPWYRVFASDDISSTAFYGLTLAERGLLDSIARVCWIEGSAPEDPRLLALAVRAGEEDVRNALTDRVRAHLVPGPTPGTLAHREIARQRGELAEVRAAQSAGGRRGAAMTNGARRRDTSGEDETRVDSRVDSRDESRVGPTPTRVQPAGVDAGSERVTEVQCNALPCNATPSSGKDDWVNDYETVERKQDAAEHHRRVANGH